MTFDKTSSAGYLANHMARLFAQGLHARIKAYGLSPAQFMTLLELWDEDGLTQKQLIERLDVEQATMANTLARMERDNLVRRLPHPDDGRVRRVWLTETARVLREPATRAAFAQNRHALSGLTDDERRTLIALMTRVVNTMRKRDTTPSSPD
ncbi:MarR family winged helix-turn-helix transcriptional regulator [Roseospira visakhapatnamensis]|uniref:DNA-binding MarR family transcriptional regulator n=1 Tax=Roseospira visakhapatnamensis TaxID=390880 RepID=A0A7W6RAU0_9PROT|nr:MarR family transcriptional regulator [Roseospira visakhapatnamensis]MBB4265072.1 DNA-binding MarR family transcriptional regulator [Roseospira visakhapatnamensis]